MTLLTAFCTWLGVFVLTILLLMIAGLLLAQLVWWLNGRRRRAAAIARLLTESSAHQYRDYAIKKMWLVKP